MNKNEIVAAVADKAGLSKAAANSAVDAVFGSITEALKKDGEVKVLGFGNFVVSERAASTGRNPKTGEPIDIQASRQAKFRPGKALKDALNG